MLIGYKDHYPRGVPDYQGTQIFITADNKKEARKIDIILVANREEIFDELAYGYEREGLMFRFIGYDGFLASVIERMLTGNRDTWQKGHPRRKSIINRGD